jgi:hypothetical protein
MTTTILQKEDKRTETRITVIGVGVRVEMLSTT